MQLLLSIFNGLNLCSCERSETERERERERDTFFDEMDQVPSLVAVLCAKLHAEGT